MAVRANCPLDQSTSDISIDSSIELGLNDLLQHVIPTLLIAAKVTLQQVWEKEKPEHSKHNKQFDQDDSPKISAPGHVSETIIIELVQLSDHHEQELKMKLVIKGN